MGEIERLTAENARLREALEKCGPLLSPRAYENLMDQAEADCAVNGDQSLTMLLLLHDNVRSARAMLVSEANRSAEISRDTLIIAWNEDVRHD